MYCVPFFWKSFVEYTRHRYNIAWVDTDNWDTQHWLNVAIWEKKKLIKGDLVNMIIIPGDLSAEFTRILHFAIEFWTKDTILCSYMKEV